MPPGDERPREVPSADDYEAIVASIRDYVEGWYGRDADRMARCLHPELSKRTVVPGPAPGAWVLRPPTGYDRMVTLTREGGGSEVPPDERRYQIDVLQVFRRIAMARCVSPQYVDLLHLAKVGDGRWLIVDALWESREAE